MSKRSTDIATAIVDVARRMGYDIVQTEAVSEFRGVDLFVALRTGLPLVFGELWFEQKCTVVVATPNLVAAKIKNDFPRSHLHHVQ